MKLAKKNRAPNWTRIHAREELNIINVIVKEMVWTGDICLPGNNLCPSSTISSVHMIYQSDTQSMNTNKERVFECIQSFLSRLQTAGAWVHLDLRTFIFLFRCCCWTADNIKEMRQPKMIGMVFCLNGNGNPIAESKLNASQPNVVASICDSVWVNKKFILPYFDLHSSG